MLGLDSTAIQVIWVVVSLILFGWNNKEGNPDSGDYNPNGANSAVVIVFLWTAFWFTLNYLA